MALKALVKRIIWLAAQVPALLPAVIAYYELKPDPAGWKREHPFDRANRVRTNGQLPGFVLRPGDPIDAPTTVYGAAQPSIIRTALAVIPDPRRCHFIDLGCGKGRPLFVASEFDFLAITGVELSPTLSRIARRNAASLARVHPNRTPIEIIVGDALAYQLPEQPLAIFLYNPFGRLLMAQLVRSIEASLREAPRDIYVVYYNPVWAEVLDASAALERRYAAQLPYADDEIGFGPDQSDAVVIWQNRSNSHPSPPGVGAAPVTIVSPGWRVEIA